MEIHERINFFIEKKDLNANQFAKSLGFDRAARVYNILAGKNSPNFEFLDLMLNTYPEISTEWLLRGEGKMLRSEEEIQEAQETEIEESFGSRIVETLEKELEAYRNRERYHLNTIEALSKR